MTKVLAFAGSTRKGSYNKMLCKEASELARQMGAEVTYIDLKDYPIPFYDGDLEQDQKMPENVKKMRALIREHDALIIASPEYNSSIPAVLKNMVDWASRSEEGGSDRAILKGKQVLLMSTSAGGTGGKRMLPHLKSVITNIQGDVIAKEVSIPFAAKAFTMDGQLTNQEHQEALKQAVHELLSASRS